MVSKSKSNSKKGVGIDERFEFAPSSNELRIQHIVDAKRNCQLRFGTNEHGDVTTLVLPQGHAYKLRYRLDAAKSKCIIEIEQDLHIQPTTISSGKTNGKNRVTAMTTPLPPPPSPPMGICFCPGTGLSRACPPGMVAACTPTSITCVPGPSGSATETLVAAPRVMVAPVNGHVVTNGSGNGHAKPQVRKSKKSKAPNTAVLQSTAREGQPPKTKASQAKVKARGKK